jgi:hypothetical protein
MQEIRHSLPNQGTTDDTGSEDAFHRLPPSNIQNENVQTELVSFICHESSEEMADNDLQESRISNARRYPSLAGVVGSILSTLVASVSAEDMFLESGLVITLKGSPIAPESISVITLIASNRGIVEELIMKYWFGLKEQRANNPSRNSCSQISDRIGLFRPRKSDDHR